ncbi:hypothetical protein PV05_12065 [Exophiala xenobiotica]|uniref:Xylanolytic transcriptional activator regulatory domain-containing protein n=1 Tax=Exophiala xenobiotica TaxID=348802 RepID=A0A0D2E6X6_9EURO|nr:uncharacterized protein PV05_12065 [Exophiala xenobiotica]KIW50480.1 hypothetical protein PV05_12065 [Exophiala xenobiotica]
METDSYQESIRCGASRSLAIFIRIISTFDITGIFDPDFTLPGSFSSRETSLYHSQESRTSTWGLPSSVTLMDFSGATGVSVSPRSSACGDEAPPVAYQTYDLNCESPQFAMPQPTETSMESGEPWILPCEPSPSPEPDDCLWVSNEIITRLRDGISQQSLSQSPYPREWSSWLQNDCFALFGPNSLRKFTEEYWSTWHIHWPVIHRTKFRIPTASAALVAAMVLLGASYSSDATTRGRARYWADSVEAMVFADEYFGSATVFSALNAACMERRLRALQAGHAMCIYQTFEGNTMARRRARRSRFNEVVANGRHENLEHVTIDMFRWEEFILKEELIRTLVYMIVLDSSFVILYNTIPRVMVSEMQTAVACPEACFQATTESECLQHLRAWMSHPLWKGRRMSIAGAFEILSGTDLDFQTQQMFAQFGDLNLYILTCAFHSTVFYIRNFILPFDHTVSIANFSRNWRRIWTLRKLLRFREAFGTPAQAMENEAVRMERWRQTGFMKEALQFWLLGQIMLESKKPSKVDKNSEFSNNNAPIQFDQPCMNDLKQYLRGFDRTSTCK